MDTRFARTGQVGAGHTAEPLALAYIGADAVERIERCLEQFVAEREGVVECRLVFAGLDELEQGNLFDMFRLRFMELADQVERGYDGNGGCRAAEKNGQTQDRTTPSCLPENG